MARGVDNKTDVGQARRSSRTVGLEGKEASQSIAAKLKRADSSQGVSLFQRLRKKAVTLLAAGAIVLSPAALAACSEENALDYRPPAQPTKVHFPKDSDKVSYQVNTISGQAGGSVTNPAVDPEDLATRGVISVSSKNQNDPRSEVEFIGKDLGNSFEVQGFRVKVENPLPARDILRDYYEQDYLDDLANKIKESQGVEKVTDDQLVAAIQEDLKSDDNGRDDYQYFAEVDALRAHNTPPPVEVVVGLADLESYKSYGRGGAWVSNNPIFSVEGILQDGKWQSAYLEQPMQLAKGQQYVITVVYQEKGYYQNTTGEGPGLYVNSGRIAAQAPVTFDSD